MWRFRSNGPGAGFCVESGEDVFLLSQPGFIERIRHFVWYGMPAMGSWGCPNGHDVAGTIGSTRQLTASPLSRLLRVPIEVARAIHEARSIDPVPATYLIAAGLGAVIGIVLDLWVGWPWWLVTLGVVAAVWLLFLASAFRADSRRHLAGRLRHLVDPHGQQRRDLEDFTTRVNAGAIRAYGVPCWEGPLGLGGWTGRDAEISSVRLAHRTSRGDSMPAIEVEFHSSARHYRRGLREELLEVFMFDSLERPEPAASDDFVQRMHRWRWQALQQSPPMWEEASIDVDDAAVVFDVLQRPGAFVAIAAVGGHYLAVKARGFEPGSFSVVAVNDIAPYVEGTLAAKEAHRRENDED